MYNKKKSPIYNVSLVLRNIYFKENVEQKCRY